MLTMEVLGLTGAGNRALAWEPSVSPGTAALQDEPQDPPRATPAERQIQEQKGPQHPWPGTKQGMLLARWLFPGPVPAPPLAPTLPPMTPLWRTDISPGKPSDLH